MLPYLQEGDWVLTESISTRWFPDKKPIEVGEVVVVKSPLNPDHFLVKRVIALEGDVVPNKLGKRLPNSYDYDGNSIRVPPHAMWLEGDNKTASKDSREYGPVSKHLMTYRAVFKVYPSFKRLADPWLVRLLNGDVLWTPKHAPPTKPADFDKSTK
jgi:signal peptidase I